MRAITTVAGLFATAMVAVGCYNDLECHPLLKLRDSSATSPVLNEADWVTARTDAWGDFFNLDNTILTEGLAARRVFSLVDTEKCSELALRVHAPDGALVTRRPRQSVIGYEFRCELGAMCDTTVVEAVDVTVDWTPRSAGPTEIAIAGIDLVFELEVARDLTGSVPEAVLPSPPCAFVAQLATGVFLCDARVMTSAGVELASTGEFVAVDANGPRWLATVPDSGVLGVFEWTGLASHVATIDAGLIALRPVLTADSAFFVNPVGLHAYEIDAGVMRRVETESRPTGLSRSRGQILWLEANKERQRACRVGPGGGAVCTPVVGQVVGTNRGLWLEGELEDGGAALSLLQLDSSGSLLRVDGPTIHHGRINETIGYSAPFRRPLHPGTLATRSMCAFREVNDNRIGLSVYPEGEIKSARESVLQADGNGHEDLRWCTGNDGRRSKTYVYLHE